MWCFCVHAATARARPPRRKAIARSAAVAFGALAAGYLSMVLALSLEESPVAIRFAFFFLPSLLVVAMMIYVAGTTAGWKAWPAVSAVAVYALTGVVVTGWLTDLGAMDGFFSWRMATYAVATWPTMALWLKSCDLPAIPCAGA